MFAFSRVFAISFLCVGNSRMNWNRDRRVFRPYTDPRVRKSFSVSPSIPTSPLYAMTFFSSSASGNTPTRRFTESRGRTSRCMPIMAFRMRSGGIFNALMAILTFWSRFESTSLTSTFAWPPPPFFFLAAVLRSANRFSKASPLKRSPFSNSLLMLSQTLSGRSFTAILVQWRRFIRTFGLYSWGFSRPSSFRILSSWDSWGTNIPAIPGGGGGTPGGSGIPPAPGGGGIPGGRGTPPEPGGGGIIPGGGGTPPTPGGGGGTTPLPPGGGGTVKAAPALGGCGFDTGAFEVFFFFWAFLFLLSSSLSERPSSPPVTSPLACLATFLRYLISSSSC
mmetsp:Transcript_33140/g.80509  ORF Transcript_33140/g.80509 Transcript_33140/m.80509 type:complete len:335 (-) Transcript_33140:3570-4574(-)